jgi:hypothetical protein
MFWETLESLWSKNAASVFLNKFLVWALGITYLNEATYFLQSLFMMRNTVRDWWQWHLRGGKTNTTPATFWHTIQFLSTSDMQLPLHKNSKIEII